MSTLVGSPECMSGSPRFLEQHGTCVGSGWLRVERVAGLSTVVSTQASAPLKVLIPRARGLSVWAYLSSFGGGLVAGDCIQFRVEIGAEARCFVSSQASTKVFKNPNLLPCGHQFEAWAGIGSLLVLAPDPVQAFTGSIYSQRQTFHLDKGASLVLVDWFTSGRVACGERWAFSHFESRNEIFVEGQRLVIDSVRLDPRDGPLRLSHRMSRYNCFASVVIIGEALKEGIDQVLIAVAKRAVVQRASIIFTASPIRGGVLLRLAGETVEEVSREIRAHLNFISALLGDDPLIRKW